MSLGHPLKTHEKMIVVLTINFVYFFTFPGKKRDLFEMTFRYKFGIYEYQRLLEKKKGGYLDHDCKFLMLFQRQIASLYKKKIYIYIITDKILMPTICSTR